MEDELNKGYDWLGNKSRPGWSGCTTEPRKVFYAEKPDTDRKEELNSTVGRYLSIMNLKF